MDHFDFWFLIFFVFSGHKMLGPNGFGVLYSKSEILKELSPFMVGGNTVENSNYDSSVLLPPPEKFEAGLPSSNSTNGSDQRMLEIAEAMPDRAWPRKRGCVWAP
jgi:cysteine desulfurase/selenocysteine lyase